jgi:DNA replication protein DnaC
MDCEICHGTRWKSVEEDGIERVVRCDCWRTNLVEGLLADAGIPPKFKRAELSTFEHDMDTQRAAWGKAMKFVELFPVVDRGLLFHGLPGVGKTHLAVGILKEVIRTKGARGYFFETADLLTRVRNTYNRSVEETEMGVLSPVLEADLLVLDDLGGTNGLSAWGKETLGMVVNTRYNGNRATIFTTNLSDPADNTEPNSLIFQVGARTRSRLFEMCEWIEIKGADVREVGPHATPEKIDRWQKESPGSPHNIKKSRERSEAFGSPLPPKSRGMARAKLRTPAPDLKWSGGKAGSK